MVSLDAKGRRCRNKSVNASVNASGIRLPIGPSRVSRIAVAGLFILVINFCCAEGAESLGQSVPTAATPPNAKVVATNLRGFGIPFRIDANDESLIEVQLYQSSDRGQTWQFHSRRTTDNTEFPFQAEGDGEYWFALKTLDRNRQLLPLGDPKPELVILVDTVQPKLDFRIETDPAGRVNCRWRATDDNLDTKSLQIFYQSVESVSDDSQEDWLKVPVQLQGITRNGVYSDQIGWWPETTAKILKVRLAIADTAGNLIQEDRFVSVPPSPWRHQDTAIAQGGDPQTSFNQLSNSPPAAQPQSKTAANQTSKKLHCENGVCYLKAGSTQRSAELPKANKNIDASQNRALNSGQRVAASSNQIPSSSNLPLVGGPPEFVAPPVPAGLDAAPPQLRSGTPPALADSHRRPPGNSISWNSEPERWIPEHQSSVSTTYGPDPRILPNPYVDRSDPNSGLPPSNPSSMKTVGEQVVCESTTMQPQNQYRGPAFNADGNLLASEPVLLPGQSPNNPDQLANSQRSGESETGNYFNGKNVGNNSPGYRAVGHRSRDAVENTREQGTGSQDGSQKVRRSVMESLETKDSEDSAIQSIGSRRFRLNYGIDAIDPSGVARVDLWLTRDGGQSWDSWGHDPDNTSPFPVEVQDEGRYGFRIVVHSKDGLTGRGPSSGDEPDIWIQVDTTSPMAQITSVPYGRGDEAGRLVINYSVVDPHLVLRPITLAFSRNPEGPWTAIEQGLRNEGRYTWKPSTNVPDRIFLRLDARDRAGNVGVHILSQPIDVSGLVPRGTIHGVVPVGN